MIDNNAKDFFIKNDYVLLKNFINLDTAKLIYQYCITQVRAVNFKIENKLHWHPHYDGTFLEHNNAFDSKNSFNRYGDPLMDSIMLLSKNYISELVNKELYETYSFWRLYEKGDQMLRHIDRSSCEVSATICLGYNYENVDENKYPEYLWPIYLGPNTGEKGTEGMPIKLDQGDALIYKGTKIEHWREKFLGLNQAQVFIHYCSDYENYLDGRLVPGIPHFQYKEA